MTHYFSLDSLESIACIEGLLICLCDVDSLASSKAGD